MRLIVTLLLLCMLQLCNAQPYVNVRTFSIRDGLAANLTSGMSQTSDGLMWFPTWNGLCCYDGYRFFTFRSSDVAEEGGLSSNRIIMIEPNSKGDIWCLTYDHQLYLFNTSLCRFTKIDITAVTGKASIQARKIHSLKNGHTWITCQNDGGGLIMIDDEKATDTKSMIWYPLTGSKMLKGTIIKKVMVDDDGHETIVTDKGMMLVHTGQWFNIVGDHMEQMGHCLYYASPKGQFAMFNKQTKRLTMLPMPAGVTAVNCMIKEGKKLYLGTNAGIVMADPSNRSNRFRCEFLPVISSSLGRPGEGAPVTNIFADHRGRLWVFTDADGVTMIKPSSASVHFIGESTSKAVGGSASKVGGSAISSQTFLTKGDNIPFFHVDNNHTVWVIPRGGTFSFYDERTGKLVPYPLQATGYTYPNIPVINKYFIDSQNNAWVRSIHDLSLLNFRHHAFRNVIISANADTRALCATHDGKLWIGTSDGRVMLCSPSLLSPATMHDGSPSGSLSYLTSSGALTSQPVKMSDHVYTMLEDNRHRLWIGTKGDGLYLLDSSGNLRHFMQQSDNPYSLADKNIYALDQDASGRIWVGTYGSGPCLVSEKEGDIRFIHSRNDLKGYPTDAFCHIRRITHTPQGIIILSTTDGLVTFAGKAVASSVGKPTRPSVGESAISSQTFHTSTHIAGDTTSLLTNDVLQTLVTKSGQIYVTTMGGGIQSTELNVQNSKLKAQSSMFKAFRTIKAFSVEEGNAWSLTEDEKGDIWVVREATINRYHPATGCVEQYGPNDLYEKTEFTEALTTKDPSGRIYLPTLGGFVHFKVSETQRSTTAPNIVFTRVQYHGDDTPHSLLRHRELTIERHQRSLTVNFAAIDYSDKYLVQYAYRTDSTAAWTVIGNTPRITFSDLPPGRYALQVKSTNSDGVWTDNITTLILDVRPMPWERTWVRLLLSVMFIAVAAWGVIRYNRHRQAVRRREQHLQNILRQYRELIEANNTPSIVEEPAPSPTTVSDGSPVGESAIPSQTPPSTYRLEEPEIRNEDDEMMQQLMAFIEQRIGDENLKIEEMAEAVSMSRTTFYEKLKSLVGTSPSEFLRQLRMQRAQDLMARSAMNVSQVAYAVGFTDPKYFTRCFRKAVGMSPTEYRERHRA